MGVIYSGMGPDSRILVRKARKAAQMYFMTYNERIPVAQLVREVATVMQVKCSFPLSPLPLCRRSAQQKRTSGLTRESSEMTGKKKKMERLTDLFALDCFI